MTQVKELAFSGQTIYVGIDVHRKDWKICILLEELFFKQFTQPPQPLTLSKYLQKHFPGAKYKSVYEAGFCGFWIHDELTSLGINNIVVNPADVPTTDKEKKQKTDKRDALKLAKALRGGGLEAIYVPPRDLLEHRSLIRLRDRHVTDLVRTKNRIKAHLHFFGIAIPQAYAKCNWSKNFVNWLEQAPMQTPIGKTVLDGLIDQFRLQRELLSRTTRRVRDLAKTACYKKRMTLLLSVPGIGCVGGMKILVEIVDIRRFAGIKRLGAYVGLIPNTASSGDNERVGEITPRGNRQLKKIMIEACWIAIRNDPALALKYAELRKTMKAQKAIVRIARKLLNRIRFVLLNEQEYEIGMVQ